MENEIENDNSLNVNDEAPVGLPEDPVEVEPKDEDVQDEEKEVLKARNQELYEQLKKAKGFIRDKDGKWVKKETLQPIKETKISEDVTRTELYSLVRANVPDEDTEECIIYAKSHGLSVTDALKTPELKAILNLHKEQRTSAEASNTSASRKGTVKITSEQILEKAKAGELPEDPSLLVKAMWDKKREEYDKNKR
jgi:hypothetical protein